MFNRYDLLTLFSTKKNNKSIQIISSTKPLKGLGTVKKATKVKTSGTQVR